MLGGCTDRQNQCQVQTMRIIGQICWPLNSDNHDEKDEITYFIFAPENDQHLEVNNLEVLRILLEGARRSLIDSSLKSLGNFASRFPCGGKK